MDQGYTRRFSLEDDFMNYSSDDLLFGAMQYLATFHPEMKMLYLTKKNYKKEQKELLNLIGASAKTLSRHLEKLIERGLVKERKIYIGAEKVEYDCYTFPFNFNGKYQIVDNEMLWYVVSTRNHQAVRVYLTLLNWYKWKEQSAESYVFDNKDILQKLGYSVASNNALASSMVTNILESFWREGVINYVEFMEEKIDHKGNIVKYPQKRLLFVAEKKSQLKTAPKAEQ